MNLTRIREHGLKFSIIESKRLVLTIHYKNHMNKRKAGIFSLILFSVVVILHFLHFNKILNVPEVVLISTRWLFILSLLYFALLRKTLTTWILVSMVIGVEIGLDFPSFAQNLQVLSKIFLRLVKTIIAPILFATLVVGIAGHSNLRQVGRMGWKSILYFEIVTTLALFIGLIAINISGAGKGIVLPEGFHQELPQSKPENWQDVILHIFPENFVKSIYNGDVLPIVVFSIIFGIA